MPRLVGRVLGRRDDRPRAGRLPRPARRAPAGDRAPRRRRLVRRVGDLRPRPDRRGLRARRAPGRGRAPLGRAASRAARRSRREGARAVRLRAHLLRPARQPDGRRRRCGRRARAMGAELAREARPRPTWWSACPTAARRPRSATRGESGIPYAEAVVRNRYVGRSFIQPEQTMRQQGIRLKFNPLPGRDRAASAWWWSTTPSCAGTPPARSSPCCSTPAPPRCTCASRARRSCGPATTASTWPTAPSWWPPAARVEEIAALTGAGLARLPQPGGAAARPRAARPRRYCRACFTGEYPIPVPDSSLKLRFEPGAREPARV